MIERKKVNKSCQSKLHSSIKSLDQFGNPISLTYQGEDTYKTACGGIASLIGSVLVISYFLMMLTDVINRKADVKISTVKSDINERQKIDNENFQFAFGIQNGTALISHYLPFFNVSVYLHELDNSFDLLGGKRRYLEFKQQDSMNILKFDKLTLFGDQTVLGANSVLKFEVSYCDQTYLTKVNPGRLCQSKTYIDQTMTTMSLLFAIQNRQFNQDNYDQLVSDSVVYDLQNFDSSSLQIRTFKIKKFELTLQDSVLGWFIEKTSQFYSTLLDTKDSVSKSSYKAAILYPNSLFLFTFQVSTVKDQISRNAYSIWTCLSAVGGMYTTIFGLISFFVKGIFSQSLLLDIIGDTFQKIKDENGKFGKAKRILPTFSNEIAKKAQQQLQNREVFSLSLLQYWRYKLVKNFRWCTKDKKKTEQYQLIKQALVQGKKEFDIQNMIKRLRNIKLLSKILLNNYHLRFMPFMKQNIINYHLIKDKRKMKEQKPYEELSCELLVQRSYQDAICAGILRNLFWNYKIEVDQEQQLSLPEQLSSFNNSQNSSKLLKNSKNRQKGYSDTNLNNLNLNNLSLSKNHSQNNQLNRDSLQNLQTSGQDHSKLVKRGSKGGSGDSGSHKRSHHQYDNIMIDKQRWD